MDKNEIIHILNDWNFWNKELRTGIFRQDYLDRLDNLCTSNQVIAITGPRRAGKSFIKARFLKFS